MSMVIFPFSPNRQIFAGVWMVLACLVVPKNAHGTHNRAGEITYSHVQGLTYEVVITTYTKASALADRPWL